MGDVGFERSKKGFIMHADDYDWGAHGKKFKLGALNKKYVENKITKYVRGTSKYNIYSRRENDKEQLEIHLRINH